MAVANVGLCWHQGCSAAWYGELGTRLVGARHPVPDQYCQHLSGYRDKMGAAPKMALSGSGKFLPIGMVAAQPQAHPLRVGSCGVLSGLVQILP